MHKLSRIQVTPAHDAGDKPNVWVFVIPLIGALAAGAVIAMVAMGFLPGVL